MFGAQRGNPARWCNPQDAGLSVDACTTCALRRAGAAPQTETFMFKPAADGDGERRLPFAGGRRELLRLLI